MARLDIKAGHFQTARTKLRVRLDAHTFSGLTYWAGDDIKGGRFQMKLAVCLFDLHVATTDSLSRIANVG